MKRLLCATIALVALCAPVRAADLPVKALPPQFFVNTSGFYWGVEAGAGVQQASANGSPLFANSLVSGKLNADGGTVGGCIGYMTGHAASWYAIQGCLDYQNISSGLIVANQPVGIATRWSGTLEARWGGGVDPLGTISGLLGNIGVSGISFPTFAPVAPAGFDVGGAAPRSYIAAGAECFGVRGSVGSAEGADVACGPMLKVGAIWQIYKKNPAGLDVPTGNAVDVSAAVTWPSRGFELTNLGASGGGAPGFAGGVDTGTRYMGKVAVLLPVPR
jgi:hypothetical protein